MSRHPGIDFNMLRCLPALDLPELEAVATPGLEALATGRAAGGVYVPALKLQLLGQTLVPLEAIQEPWCLGFEVRREFQGQAVGYATEFDVEDDAREACVLANFYSRNFFHWMTEELPKVLVLERAGFSGGYVVGALPAFAHESLALLGIPPERIWPGPAAATRYAGLHFASAINARTLDRHPDVFHALRNALLDAAPPEPPARRLWLRREAGVNNPGRDFVNGDEIAPILDAYGFEHVDMGALPFARQVALAATAGGLGGAHGAGFVHAMLMPPRSAVIECFSPKFINPGVFETCRLLRHRHWMLADENCYDGYPHGNMVRVNPSQLRLVLQAAFD
jgi:hypothetical protein